MLPPALYELEYGFGSCYGSEEEAAAAASIRSGSPGNGPHVIQFESEFARYLGAGYALATSSGTAALQLAMKAIGVGPGDEVITTPLSWMSTANAAAGAGARVVFADVDPRTFTLDPASVAERITERTRAIVPVHLYGHPADMEAILEIARPRGIRVVEDCAHSPGASWNGRKVGTFGDAAIFSFGYQKNMGTLGEGGMFVSSDTALTDRVLSHRWICTHGYQPNGRFARIPESGPPMGKRYWYLDFDEVGFNYRMTDVQAAVGLVQLRKLDAMNDRRRQIAARYSEGLAGIRGLTLPFIAPGAHPVFHVYCVLVDQESGFTKEEFMWELAHRHGVNPWQHYVPIHLTEAYRRLGHHRGECPVAESLYERYVSLPIHPRLTDAAVEYLIASVRAL